jgi:hypothetical protein
LAVGNYNAENIASTSTGATTQNVVCSGTVVNLASDYFRSRATGNWNVASTWESSSDGTNWVNATLTPTSSANIITIQNTHTVTVTASVSADQFTVNAGGQLTVSSGQTLTIADGIGTDLTVNGTLVNSGSITTTGTLVFNSTSAYQHNQNGGTIPTATWNAASTCSVTGIIDTAPSGFGQTFGNFVWNCPSQTIAAYSTDGDITVNGNFTLSAGFFDLSNGTATRIITINGNYIQTGGTFDFNTGTSGNTNMTLGGNLSLTSGAGSMTTSGVGAPNGIITFNGSGIQTMSIPTIGASIWVKYSIPSGKSVKLLSNITLNSADLASQAVYQGEIIINGTLDLSTYTVTQNSGVAGTAVFTVNAGANLITANDGGISGSVSATNMTNTFSSGANYEFQGATTGTFTTTPTINTVNNLSINRSAGVTLNQNISVNGTLNLASGIFTTGANTITVTNNLTGAVTGGSPTNFVNGPLIWQLATGQTYLYPIGKGSTYLPFGITGITGTNPMITVEAFTGNAGGTATSPLASLSTTEYWLASVAGGTYTNGSVSLTRQTALAGLNAIGRSATINGAYSSLNGTVSGMSVINSNNTGSSLGYFVMAAKSLISTSAISGSPFCAGATVSVPFTITGIFTSGNVFTAQLSDVSGSFTTPVNIGSLTQVTGGTISGTIAAGTVSGSGYRIRVVSSTPAATGTDNGSDLTVNSLPAQPSAITGNITVCQTSSQIYSVTNVAGVTYTWTFPTGWTQTAGGLTNSVTVTVGSGSGNVQVTPSTCGNGTSRTLAITTNAAPSAPTTTGATICIGNTVGTTLSASGAVAGDTYKWYDAATAGNLLKTSTNNTDNTYTTAVLAVTTNYWVSILNAGGCEGLRTLVTATFPPASPDDSSVAGTDSWIGHVYDGIAFTTYYGWYNETESFNESFGGATTCFALNSSLGTRSIYTETFSVHYRMNSTKRGLYIVDLGSDDGSSLTVDGTLLYYNWADQAYTARPRVLMSLKGTSSLVYDFYENVGANQVVFQNLTLVLANTLTTGASQSIYVGGTWTTISGDVFGTLPTGITLSGTGYQWSYSTTPLGTRTTISGATGATYTPSSSVAPFNTPGIYYLYRNAILSSTNNLGATPNPYIATNESNAATLIMSNVSSINTSTTTLTGLNYPFGFGPSAEQSFTVSGTNVSANLVITPSANFEISTGTGALFVASNPITLLVNNGNVSTTTIYVRLKAGLSIGTVPAENIVCTSNGLTPKNVACSGAVTTTPVITATPNLTGFSYPYTNGPSSQQTFTVSGTNLVANVTVTPSASFEISTTSGSGFISTPITLTPTGGTLAATTIYVRMKSGLGIGGYSENIVSSSTSTTSQNVNCSGTVMGSNLILLSTSSLSGFIYTLGSGPSAPQSFTVNGTLLGTNNIVITPATNYAISLTSGGTYQTTALTLTQSGGTVNTTTIYVRLVAGLAVGTYLPINIPVSSSGAITKSVGCSGAVVSTPTIMVSKNTLTGFGYMAMTGPSSPQSFTVSGASLTANVSITPPANYEISLTSGGTYQSTALTLTQTGGVLVPTTIYVRLKSGLTAGNYNGGNVVVTSGAVTKNIACVGIVFANPLITAGVSPASACEGSTVNLTSVGESTIANRYWQGPNSFYSTLQNPVLTNVTTSMTGTYTVTGDVVVGGNLVTNGDFELGNTSFGSSYALAAQTADGMVPESTYDVLVNPHDRHADFQPCPDHTTGTGKQMVVNGSPVAGAVIWAQSVPVIPGASYQFTYWVQSVVARAPSQLQLYVNGVAVGPVYTADFATCSWKQFAYNASAGSNTSLNLELINQNTIANGNDFALDDIVFQQILPATSSVDLTVNPNLPVSVSLVANPNPTYTGTNVTFTAIPVNGGSPPTSYEWFVNGTLVNTSLTPTYSSSTLSNNDLVAVRLTSSLSCVTGNPANASVIMMVSTRVNYWYGFTSTDWGTASNWTANYIPAAGDDVEFATVANYGSAAIRDLYVDIHRTIGSLIDATIKSTVIPSNKELTVNRNLNLGSSAHINASAQYSTIEFAGTLAQTIPAATFTNDQVYDILINNSHNVTLYGTMRLLHEITAPAGRLDATTQSPTVVYAGDPYAFQTIEMNRYLNNSMYNLGIYNVFGVWLSTTASIYVPNDCTITRGVLTVPPGATLTVDDYTKLDYRAPLPVIYPLQIDYWSCLVLKSDSVLTGSFVHSDLFSSAIGNGTVKVERYMSHTNNWHLYSSPIKDESLYNYLKYNPEIPDVFTQGTNNLLGNGLRDYNTVTNIWNPYYIYPNVSITPGSIGLGKGFNIRTIYNYNSIPGTGRVDATGTPNLNTVNVAIPRSATPGDFGWNCIGNPFTCALNIRNTANNGFLNAANISQLDPNYIAVYLWDTNNITTNNTTPEYIVINNATTITSIQTAQGFFVKSKVGGGNVTFSKNMQLPNAALSFKAAPVEWPSIKIVAWDQISSSSTEIKFVTNTTKGLDPGYDAGLYIANPDFSIYSKLVDDNGVDYTLQCLPDQDYDQNIIPIGIDHKASGQIIFTAEIINLPSGCHAVLEDRLTNTFTRLDLKGANYKATVDTDTKGTGRFFLHTYDAISSQPIPNQQFKVYSVAKNIYIIGEVSGDARFYLYTVDGKLLANFNAQNQLQNQLDASNYAAGLYLLKIIDGNLKKTIKFVLEN